MEKISDRQLDSFIERAHAKRVNCDAVAKKQIIKLSLYEELKKLRNIIIKTPDMHAAILNRIDALMDAKENTNECLELELLSGLVDYYESEQIFNVN